MQESISATIAAGRLRAVKAAHTLVWVLIVGCIVAIPPAVWFGKRHLAGWLIVVVMLEALVLLANRRRCPLTGLAARYTDDRSANFDIYLPKWLARHNKLIFSTLYLIGMALAAAWWDRG